jgi:uroporphyrinogen-III synthase
MISPLDRAGLSARRIAVYETLERDPASTTLAALGDLDAVLLHSPRAARKLAQILGRRPAPKLRAFCLSAAVAQPLEAGTQAGLASVAFAPHPSETALLDLLTA